MWTGVAAFLVLVVVGVGCYFTGRCDGIQWVLENTVIKYDPGLEDEKETD